MVLLTCSRKVISLSVAGAAALVIVIVLLVVLIPRGSDTPTYPQVRVEQGLLEGEWMEAPTGDGFQFASFRGIPYAQPPLGKFRFRAPRPPVKWDGVREARTEGEKCIQRGTRGAVAGSEDCLNLSVFTPRLPEKGTDLLPVIVFIHGGVWVFGDNAIEEYGPHYLVHEQVVMVTLKYRLSAFGFLSLDTEEIPGNAAIKDMVAGVEWVYTNIDKFGGDPKRITIAGQSAGAASAHWLAQLPALRGKIQQAIIMSGSAYHNWAFIEKNLDVAQQLGQKLRKTTSTLSKEELTDLFINTSVEDFGMAAIDLHSELSSEYQPDVAWAPTREVRPVIENGEPRVITKDAESYFLQREVAPVPTIMGVTNREWTPMLYNQFAKYNDTQLRTKLQNLMFLIPKNIIPWKDTQQLLNIAPYDTQVAYEDIMKKINEEYFATTNATCDLHCKALLYGDNVMMQLDTNRWAQYRAEKHPDVPVYLYRFSQTSEYDPIRVPGFTAPFASHGADLRHVLRYTSLKQDYSGNSAASVTLRRMTKMFGNFVKYGKPVPQKDELLPVAWEPNKSTQSKVTLMDIDEQLTLRHEELIGEHMDFWNNLYTEHRTSVAPAYPQVRVEQGLLEGEWMEAPTGDGFKFASFRGIPYAQPPLGKFRFRAPRPPVKWDGVREARTEGEKCIQRGTRGAVAGSEDCLNLSVFTPRLPEKETELLPVIVFIHGGVWVFGDNAIEEYGPDYLVHEQVVIVTLKYRLSAFGFLSLDTEEIPGNAAIKDMVAGVEWVYTNINKFGGDPKRITIAGQSAGAASAHWLAQLPALKEKIQQAIIMSGSAYHNWAFTEKNLDVAQQLGQKLSQTTSTLSKEALTDLFINARVEDFGMAALDLHSQLSSEFQPDVAWAPTREARPVIENGEPRVITKDAESYFLQREVDPVPTIMGVTNREWTPMLYYQFANYNDTQLRTKLQNLMFLIPKNIIPWKDTQHLLNIAPYDTQVAYEDIMKKINEEYFATTNATCDLHCKALLYGDNVMMQLDTNRWAQYRAEKHPDVPVYLYRFSQTSEYDPIRVPGFAAPFASHGADLSHVLHYNSLKQDYSGNGAGSVTIRRMTRMFGNFAKYGQPVPQTDELLPVAWEPNKSTQSKVTLMDIDEQLTLRHEELIGEHMDFWNNLYAEYRTSNPITS